MSKTPCPNNFEGCPDPFADQHHLYRLADADTPLKKVYSNLGCHVMHLCRCMHTEIEASLGWLEYPPTDVMLDTVNQLVVTGEVYLTDTKKRKVGL